MCSKGRDSYAPICSNGEEGDGSSDIDDMSLYESGGSRDLSASRIRGRTYASS